MCVPDMVMVREGCGLEGKKVRDGSPVGAVQAGWEGVEERSVKRWHYSNQINTQDAPEYILDINLNLDRFLDKICLIDADSINP